LTSQGMISMRRIAFLESRLPVWFGPHHLAISMFDRTTSGHLAGTEG
jgi:hypothetical protein